MKQNTLQIWNREENVKSFMKYGAKERNFFLIWEPETNPETQQNDQPFGSNMEESSVL